MRGPPMARIDPAGVGACVVAGGTTGAVGEGLCLCGRLMGWRLRLQLAVGVDGRRGSDRLADHAFVKLVCLETTELDRCHLVVWAPTSSRVAGKGSGAVGKNAFTLLPPRSEHNRRWNNLFRSRSLNTKLSVLSWEVSLLHELPFTTFEKVE